MKPKYDPYCLHSLQEQFFGCHFVITFLKAFRLIDSISSKGATLQVFGTK